MLALLFLFVAAIAFPPVAAASAFNVHDFGAIGDGSADDQPAIQRTIDAAIRSGKGAEVIIPAGTYRLAARSTRGNAQLKIDGATSLTVRGEGNALLMIGEPGLNIFGVENASDIHIEHLLIDRSPLLFSQAVVTKIDLERKTAVVAIERGYDPLDSRFVASAKWFIVFSDPASGTWGDHSAACAFYRPDDASVCWPPTITGRRRLPDSSWEVSLNVAPQGNYVGKRVLIWSGEYHAGAFLLRGSRNVSIEHVHYYGGGANGFVVTRCSGDIVLRDFSMGVPPGSDRLFAGTGGGMVFNNHAHLILDHVSITHVWDDDLNIGANYARIFQQTGPSTIKVDGTRPDLVVGDHLSILNWLTKADITQARISALDCSIESHRACSIRLDRDVKIDNPGFAENSSKGVDKDGIDRIVDQESAGSLLVEHSHFQSLHAHCLVIRSFDSMVTSSACSDTVSAGFMLGPDFYWDEGPQVRNIEIRDDLFSNVSGPNILISNGGVPQTYGARDITIENNEFVDFGQFSHGVMFKPGSPIVVQKVRDLTVKGNRFTSKFMQTLPPLVANLPSDVIIR